LSSENFWDRETRRNSSLERR